MYSKVYIYNYIIYMYIFATGRNLYDQCSRYAKGKAGDVGPSCLICHLLVAVKMDDSQAKSHLNCPNFPKWPAVQIGTPTCSDSHCIPSIVQLCSIYSDFR